MLLVQSTWIKDRVQQWGFVDGEDYHVECRSPTSRSGNCGAATDCHLTLNMAKELAMVERNEKGRQARRYFIRCEEALRRKAEAECAARRDLKRITQALANNPWAPKLSAGMLHAVLPLGAFGELSPRGVPRTGLRRACHVASRSRTKDATKLESEVQFLELIYDAPSNLQGRAPRGVGRGSM